MSTYIIPNNRDNDSRWEQMHGKMSHEFRKHQMRNVGGSPGAVSYKSEAEIEEAYCKGYEHGVNDAMKQMQEGQFKTAEFKYGG